MSGKVCVKCPSCETELYVDRSDIETGAQEVECPGCHRMVPVGAGDAPPADEATRGDEGE